jgi:hypothetical protein
VANVSNQRLTGWEHRGRGTEKGGFCAEHRGTSWNRGGAPRPRNQSTAKVFLWSTEALPRNRTKEHNQGAALRLRNGTEDENQGKAEKPRRRTDARPKVSCGAPSHGTEDWSRGGEPRRGQGAKNENRGEAKGFVRRTNKAKARSRGGAPRQG